ncbi:MAG: flavin reductase family protein [Syntrophomonadaceae bacterium]|nr:flavin reductase family protein [Syntrophomonadaceae bacterium]
MTKNIRYNEFIQETLTQLPRGSFLTVKAGEKTNTMTIGWGLIGYIWAMPVLMVAVRRSRYTCELMEQTDNFTVSFPHQGDLKGSLAEAGKKSGRDIDKFKELPLTALPGTVTESPAIAECRLVYECQTVYKHQMDPQMLSEDIQASCYSDNDYHILYFGKIVASYLND